MIIRGVYLMNLKDMQLLLATVEKINEEIRNRSKELEYSTSVKELKHVQLRALSDHKDEVLWDFEDRHGVKIER